MEDEKKAKKNKQKCPICKKNPCKCKSLYDFPDTTSKKGRKKFEKELDAVFGNK